MRNYTLIWLFLLCAVFCRASDYYIAETSQGTGSGVDAANAKPASFFNNVSNWSSTLGTSGHISPGDTVHLVGTLSTALTFQGGGTAGHPITLYFESGAKMSAPQWSGGFIISATSSVSQGVKEYIVIDGGTNGLIEATQCGTGLTYSSSLTAPSGISLVNVSHITIKNLLIRNMYVRSDLYENENGGGNGIVNSVNTETYSDFTVDNCVIHDARNGILASWGYPGLNEHYVFTNNTITNINWAIGLGGYPANAKLNDVVISGNTIGHYSNWDDLNPSNDYHHDGIFVFADDTHGYTTGEVHAMKIFNNTFLDGWGQTSTASIYINGADIDADIDIYNNTFVELDSSSNDGCLALAPAKGTIRVSNNTFIGNGWTKAISVGGRFANATSGTTATFIVKNNVGLNCMQVYATNMSAYTVLQCDYNIVGGSVFQGFYSYSTNDSLSSLDFTSWKAAGRDIHGFNTDPLLDGSYRLTSSSPAIGSGADLSSFFTTDKTGATRTVWDMGAFKYISGGDTTPPSPNPSTISSAVSTGATTISVVAGAATDASSPPVQYAVSTNNGSTWSAWQSSATFNITGLTPSTTYQCKVKARDSASTPNETAATTTASSVTTDSTTSSRPNPKARALTGGF